MLGFNPGIQKTQGTCSQYARRKQRASTKFRAAADVAVKLATACHSRAWHGNLKRDVRLKAEHDGKEKGRT